MRAWTEMSKNPYLEVTEHSLPSRGSAPPQGEGSPPASEKFHVSCVFRSMLNVGTSWIHPHFLPLLNRASSVWLFLPISRAEFSIYSTLHLVFLTDAAAEPPSESPESQQDSSLSFSVSFAGVQTPLPHHLQKFSGHWRHRLLPLRK